MKRIFTILALIFGLASFAAHAQNAAPQGDDSFAKYGQEFKGKIGRTYAESEEWYPELPKPKPGTPNVFIILLDDVGFSQLGSYGGLIKTPNLAALAADGLRYNNFHTTALCSPSRAALMASRNPHRIGLGSHALTAMGFPGYNGGYEEPPAPPGEVQASTSRSTLAGCLKTSSWATIPPKETPITFAVPQPT